MLRLSVVFKSKDLCSVEYGSMGCDDNYEWSFAGAEDEWYFWVPDIDRWFFGLAIYLPLKNNENIDKGISW